MASTSFKVTAVSVVGLSALSLLVIPKPGEPQSRNPPTNPNIVPASLRNDTLRPPDLELTQRVRASPFTEPKKNRETIGRSEADNAFDFKTTIENLLPLGYLDNFGPLETWTPVLNGAFSIVDIPGVGSVMATVHFIDHPSGRQTIVFATSTIDWNDKDLKGALDMLQDPAEYLFQYGQQSSGIVIDGQPDFVGLVNEGKGFSKSTEAWLSGPHLGPNGETLPARINYVDGARIETFRDGASIRQVRNQNGEIVAKFFGPLGRWTSIRISSPEVRSQFPNIFDGLDDSLFYVENR